MPARSVGMCGEDRERAGRRRNAEGTPHIAHFAMCGFSPQMEWVEITIKNPCLRVLDYRPQR